MTGAFAAAAATWAALVILSPWLPAILAVGVYAFGSAICHQLPDRSFHLGGSQLAVCARCTGIYAGAALAAAAALVIRPPSLPALRVAVIAAAVPTAVTVAAEWAGIWMPSHVTRAAAGATLGAAAALVAAAATLHYD